jgi:hypothetical protein
MRGLFLKVVALAALILAWWLMSPTVSVEPLRPTLDTSFAGPGNGAAFHDHLREERRHQARKAALDGLGKAWSAFCTKEGHKGLVSGLNYYFRERATQEHFYATRGPDGEHEARAAWSTADDNRIERLTRETYGRGYFKPDDFRPPVRATIVDLVRDERVTGQPCAG